MKLPLPLYCLAAASAVSSTLPHVAKAAPATVPVPAKASSPKIIVVTPSGAAAPRGPARTMNAMLQAIETSDRAAFVHDAEPAFKAALTPAAFAQVVATYRARLRGEYRVTYFGSMKKKGYEVYLWKLVFGAGGDDLLVEMSVKDGLVGGFWFL